MNFTETNILEREIPDFSDLENPVGLHNFPVVERQH